jgi:hypothetical protein
VNAVLKARHYVAHEYGMNAVLRIAKFRAGKRCRKTGSDFTCPIRVLRGLDGFHFLWMMKPLLPEEAILTTKNLITQIKTPEAMILLIQIPKWSAPGRKAQAGIDIAPHSQTWQCPAMALPQALYPGGQAVRVR